MPPTPTEIVGADIPCHGKTISKMKLISQARAADRILITFTDGTSMEIVVSEWVDCVRFLDPTEQEG